MDHDYLMHYGTKRHSGRYPWGSGEHPYQDEEWFKGWGELRKTMSEREIAEAFGMSLKEVRYRHSYGKDAETAGKIAHAQELRNTKQMSVEAIAKKMGTSASTVRNWLKPGADEKVRGTEDLCNRLEKLLDKKNMIDVGEGCANALGVNQTQFETAIQVLKDRGYYIANFRQEQTSGKHGTQMKVMVKPKDEWSGYSESEIKSAAFKEIKTNLDKIELPFEVHMDQDTKTVFGTKPITSIDSKRVLVLRAGEKNPIDGSLSEERDGLIQLRRGVEDLSLGGDLYAQVRIGVDGTHYLKGVAVYADNMPKGIDIIYNTSKSTKTPIKVDYDPNNPDPKQVLKPMKRGEDGSVDKEDPFGAQIKAGGQNGFINKVNEEKDWMDWTSNKTLASQVLSKQAPSLAKRQLNLQYTKDYDTYEEIKDISNPAVKQKMLIDFADQCDTAAIHMKAAALPGQSVKVLLPLPSAKPNEVYCPQYANGTKLALIRYPHQNISEMPIVTVNNNIREGKRMMSGSSSTAIGISPAVAQRLSGADFDGDTVLAIPNDKGWLKNAPQFKSLVGFDNKAAWPAYDGMQRCSEQHGYNEMGKITNLITDMTLQGATEDECARAIKYSMVAIDAHKHNLNLKGAYKEYRIEDLKRKYQKKDDGRYGGSGTIISRAKGRYDVPERKEAGIDKKTGEKLYYYTGRRKIYTGETYIGKDGKVKKKYLELLPGQEGYSENGKLVTQQSTRMYEAKDARKLISKNNFEVERVYADYANKMKALANQARKDAMSVESTPYSKSAAEIYKKEVESLESKLNDRQIAAALERQALRTATVIINQRVAAYPDRYNSATTDGKAHLRKMKNQVIDRQRKLLGKPKPFDITDKEWEAIQAGALHKSTVIKIIGKANQDRVKELALPKNATISTLSKSKVAHAKAMLASGYTQADVAAELGISVTTLNKMVND